MDRVIRCASRAIVLLIASAAAFGTPGLAAEAGTAQPFTYPTSGQTATAHDASGGVAVEVDAEAFERALPHGRIEVALPDGDTVRIVDLQRQDAGDDDWTLVGRVADDPLGRSAVLTFGAGAAFGVLPGRDGELWHLVGGPGGGTIAPAGSLKPAGAVAPKCFAPLCATHADTFANDVRVPTRPKSTATRHGMSDHSAAASADTTIDVLGLYSRDLATLRGGEAAAETEFRNLVALTNRAHADSGSAVRFNLVGLRAVDIPSGSSNNSVLSSVTSEAEYGGVAVRALRDELAADLVAVLRPYNGGMTCGVAWGVGFGLSPGVDGQASGFSVSNVAPCGPYTLAHELGHNLGSHHDVETTMRGTGDIDRGAYVFSHGYRQDAAPAFATVMAYERGSQAQVGRFSHPGGTACSGVACGLDGEADNVRSMRLMAPRVARFRDPPGTLSALDASRAEEDSRGMFMAVEVRFNGRVPPGGIEFTFETRAGTATPGLDFAAVAPTRMRILDGQTSAYATVEILGDSEAEPVETFSVVVTPITAGIALFDGVAEVAILDDDPKRRVSGRITFGTATPPTQPVELRFVGASDVPVPRDVTALPPDFRYAIDVRAGTRLRLESTSAPVPFASTAVDFGVIDADTTRDIPLRSGVIVSGRYIFPAGAPAPTGALLVTANIQPEGDPSRTYSRQVYVSPPGFEFSFDVPRRSDLTLGIINPPLPWLNWQRRTLRGVASDTRFDITAERGVVLSGDISVPAGMAWPDRSPTIWLHHDAGDDISPFVTVTGRSYSVAVRHGVPFTLSGSARGFGKVSRQHPGLSADARSDLVLPAMPRLLPAEIRVSERAAGSFVLAVPLSGATPQSPHSVTYTVLDQTALAGSDFWMNSNAVSWMSGAAYGTTLVSIYQDALVEGDESFLLRMATDANAESAGVDYRIVIVDDDGAAPSEPVLSASPLVANEGTGAQTTTARVRFALDRAAPAGGVRFRAATVQWSVGADAATPGRDFIALDGEFEIPAGQRSIEVPIELVADDQAEPSERFQVGIVPRPGVVLGTLGVDVTIQDDDVNRTLGARPDRFRIMEGGGAMTLDVLANDWLDVARMSGGSLAIIEAPQRGTASVDTRSTPSPADDRIVYSAATLRAGVDALRYRLCESGAARCVETSVELLVQPVFGGATVITSAASSGHADRPLATARAVESLRILARGQAVSTPTAMYLANDGGSYSPWDESGQGTSTLIRRIPSATAAREMRVVAWVEEPTGLDLDVYAGVDQNRNGRADESELRCAAAAAGVGDDCDFGVAVAADAALDYWVLVHNPGARATFDARVHAAAVDVGAAAAGLQASAPAKVGSQAPALVRLGWDLPQAAERDVGVSMLKLSVDGSGDAAWQPYRVARTASVPTPRALVASRPLSLALAGSARESMLFVDVPEGLEALEVRTTSDQNVDLALARRDLPRPTSAIPVIGAAPTEAEFLARSESAGGAERLRIERPAAGRWHVIVTNRGAPRATATVDVQFTGAVAELRPGSYFNPGRSGNGLFVYPAGRDWAGLWYTYLQDGSPTWYYLQSASPGATGVWRSAIFRSAWNGSSNHLVNVGEATVTPTTPGSFVFSYTLDGETGSEPYEAFGRGCPRDGGVDVNASGHWFDPARAGTGYSVQLFPNYEFYLVFGYDARGVPRFFVAERRGIGGERTTLDLEQNAGTCPLCVRSGDPRRATVGTLTRTWGNGTLQRVEVGAVFTAGVPGTWAANDAVVPLGGLQGCALD